METIDRKQAVESGRLAVILGAVVALTLVTDYLFWWCFVHQEKPGLALAIFGTIVTAALLLVQGRHRKPYRACGLLLGACFAAANQVCFSTVVVMMVLILYIVAENYADVIGDVWERWSEALWAVIKAPFRWLWLLGELARSALGSMGTAAAGMWYGLTIVIPAAVAVVVFASMLGAGNAIYGHWMAMWFQDFFNWLWEDLTIGRLFFWGVVSTLMLALVKPAEPKVNRWWRVTEWERFNTPLNITVAQWRSIAVLVAVNLLYFGANGIDAIYLWSRFELPAGMPYSQYVHEGTLSLTASTLVAGIVLVWLHQQSNEVISAIIKAMSHLWIAQNGLLIIGVCRRLWLYVEAYQLSLLRINLIFFLILVLTGFVILAIYVQKRKSFGWLWKCCIAATFILFYFVQFCDTPQWVAAYNVAEWQKHPDRRLDANYLFELGPTAWPYIPEDYAKDWHWQHMMGQPAWHTNWRSWQLSEYLAKQQCAEELRDHQESGR